MLIQKYENQLNQLTYQNEQLEEERKKLIQKKKEQRNIKKELLEEQINIISKQNYLNIKRKLAYKKHQNITNIISGKKYTLHALERMIERGISIDEIENIINTNTNNIKISNSYENQIYRDNINKVNVIVGKGGKEINDFVIITTWKQNNEKKE
ncbi:hypothetical protein BCR32DRAFT_307391 [Anaeromyces robustus]|nr:hypothetical protein BCR32DRAFT_307391 [Anaeromyces robustus]|eukprot:ORX63674.1 hypothetical protein BCR32DRAFT_307391 [Anaeromyces robustus]